MRLSLILTAAVTALVLSGCDQLPRIAVIPPEKAGDRQCVPAAKPACPTTTTQASGPAIPAAKIPSEPVMEPEAPRRHLAHTQARVQAKARTYATAAVRSHREVRTYAGGPAPAPAYDGQVYVPPPRAYARVEEQETRTEHYAQHQEAYGYTSGGYGQGYAQGGYAQGGYVQGGYASNGYAQPGYVRGAPCPCGPQPAAGRDRDGFLTWPGKLAQRP